jgi:hypothetical protein
MAPRLMSPRVVVASVLLGAAAGSTAALEFTRGVTPDGTAVFLLEGRFEAGDGVRFEAEVAKGGIDEVWLDSPGGLEVEGYAVGRVLRRVGLIARVPKGRSCSSACVDAFLGAPIRFVDAAFTIGVHPASAAGNDNVRATVLDVIARDGEEGARDVITAFEQRGGASAAQWIEYVLGMGVSPKLVAYATTVPHNCILMLSWQEMLLFNVVNTAGPPKVGFAPGDSRKECWSAP